VESDAQIGRIRDLLGPVVQAAGADLEEVEVSRAGRRRLVRVTVDADGGLDLDQVADVSRTVSAALDSSDLMGNDPWTLEVGTRGVATPLTLPRHWRRNVGRLVKVRGGLPTGDAEIVARVIAADEQTATLRDDESGTETEVSLASVNRAVVQIEFQRREKGASPEQDEDEDSASGAGDTAAERGAADAGAGSPGATGELAPIENGKD
jgi:ribosome maturation factor RimP